MNQTLSPSEIAFRHWWLAYPLKIAVAEARLAFGRALELTTADELIQGAHRFAGDPNRDPTYTPYPARWLAQQRWMDSPLPPRKLTPHELEQLERDKAKQKDEAEKAKGAQIEREFQEARAKAVPLDPKLKASILANLRKTC